MSRKEEAVLELTDAEHIARLPTYEVLDGWDTLDAYLLINTRLEVGERRDPQSDSAQAWQMLACARAAVDEWQHLELEPARPTRSGRDTDGWRWTKVHRLTDEYGVAAALVELVEHHYPVGEWRSGTYPGLRLPFLVARVDSTGLVALICPCRRRSRG